MNGKEMQERIKELETQAKDDYLGNIEWSFILVMLDNEEYAELKSLYKAMDNSMHTIMDNRGQDTDDLYINDEDELKLTMEGEE